MSAGPAFLHLRGGADFSRFDHQATTIDLTTETVRLATAAQAGNEPPLGTGVFQQWLDARGGAALVPCRRDGCECCAAMVVARDGTILVDRGDGLTPWAAIVDEERPIGRRRGSARSRHPPRRRPRSRIRARSPATARAASG